MWSDLLFLVFFFLLLIFSLPPSSPFSSCDFNRSTLCVFLLFLFIEFHASFLSGCLFIFWCNSCRTNLTVTHTHEIHSSETLAETLFFFLSFFLFFGSVRLHPPVPPSRLKRYELSVNPVRPVRLPHFPWCLFSSRQSRGGDQIEDFSWLSFCFSVKYSVFDFSHWSCFSLSFCVFLLPFVSFCFAPFFCLSLDILPLQCFVFSSPPALFLPLSLILSAALSIEIRPVDLLFVCVIELGGRWCSWAQRRGPRRAVYSPPWETGILLPTGAKLCLVSASACWELNGGGWCNDVFSLLCGHSSHF